MIVLTNLQKSFRMRGNLRVVADRMSFTFPTGRRTALLGRNGAGKSTLLGLIAGTQAADAGSVVSDGTISWPVGFSGSFHKDLTGKQNVLFVARIYGVDSEALCDLVKEFADLGDHFHAPFRTYSSGMRSRLSFALSMAVQFDTYLVDEVTSLGDKNFRKRSAEMLNARLAGNSAIIVSHSMPSLRQTCDTGAVLEGGRLYWYDDLEDAIAHHDENLSRDVRAGV